MIVSHTHRYIFIKSLKTAGTSVEAALSAHCQGADIVTELGDYRFNRDEAGNWVHHAMNSTGFEQHDDARTIKGKLPAEVWEGYLKFSIARNPWDRTVSLFFWEKKRKPDSTANKGWLARLGLGRSEQDRLKEEFRRFVFSDTWENNDRFYALDGRLCVERVLRYERLEEDLQQLCSDLGLPPLQLPRLKAGIRKQGLHYSALYDADTIDAVAERHQFDIRQFGYTFEHAAS
ncbi:MAG: sulfotransferase family protein [Thiobacillaceae bacterium]|nr:sulfotransferase family protein [Thiobacillaceae bacterium]MDW8322978.1 sulfotransferase family 2 domain-containing protein [Burkholderiales bacterium]